MNNAAVVKLIGEFDVSQVELFEKAFTVTMEQAGCHRIVLDMEQLSFSGSSGISSLIAMRSRLDSLEESVIYMYRANDYIVDLVRIIGIESILELIDMGELYRISGIEIDSGV